MIGTRLGPYRLDRELGAGGMGMVYAATVVDRVSGLEVGTVVAVKVVHPHLLGTPRFFKRFLREAQIGKAVVHPNVVRTFDADEIVVRGVHHHILVMEYAEGQTLRLLLAEVERVPEELCRHIGREVAKGLGAIHAAGVVHRDIKPENVLITKEHAVKVMDLGVALLNDEAVRLSQTGSFVGSIHYAAPECFESGGRDVDGRADLHALGLVLYELACATNPYEADGIAQVVQKVLHEEPRRLGDVNPQVSPFFEEVVHTLLAKKPQERFADASALLAVLEEGEKSSWWRQRAKSLREETRQPLRRIRIPRETAVYGRECEIARLAALFQRVKAGEGQVVVLEGEAGIGKTRLVDELVGRLQRQGEDLHSLFGGYPLGGGAIAAGAFGAAFQEQFGAEGAAGYLPQTPLLVPAFDALLMGDATPSGCEPLTRDSIATCFVQAARALAAQRPTILLVDDLHFALEEGRSLFTSLALAVPGHRILLVGATRPGLDEKWLAELTRLPQTSHLPLGRLGPKDLVALLRDSFRSEALAAALSAQIATKSDGNPFFAFEIIRGLREGQFITQRADGTWVSTQVIGDIKIPSSVLDLVNARVADLTEEERELLDVAACWGFEFDATLVCESIGRPRIPALRQFALVEKRHRLVRATGDRFTFDHHQVQEALYGALPAQLAREYHAALASTLEARTQAAEREPATLDGTVCTDLAEHFLEAACGERALRYLDAALAHLEKGYLNDAAIALAGQALAVPGLVGKDARCDLLLRKAGFLSLLGRRDEERLALDEALALADAGGDAGRRVKARSTLGWHLCQGSRNDEAQAVLIEALELARRAGDRRREADATGILGNALWAVGRFEESQARHERHLALARELGDRRGEAVASGNLGIVLWSVGRLAEAQVHEERQLAIARELGDRREEARATGNLGVLFGDLGRYPEALERYERQLVIAREIGDRRGEATAMGNLGHVSAVLGRHEEAQARHECHLAMAREIGDRQGEARATGNLGNLFHALGRYTEAQTYHERHRALAREIGDRQGEARATGNLGNILHALGRLDEARQHLERHRALSQEVGNRRGEAIAWHNLAVLARDEGDDLGCEGRSLTSLVLAEEAGARHCVAATRLLLGSLRAARGDWEAARSELMAARELAIELHLPGVETLARCELALLPGGEASDALAAVAEQGERLEADERREALLLLWRATGDRAQLEGANRLLDEVLAALDEEARNRVRTNLRVNRDVLAAWSDQGLEI